MWTAEEARPLFACQKVSSQHQNELRRDPRPPAVHMWKTLGEARPRGFAKSPRTTSMKEFETDCSRQPRERKRKRAPASPPVRQQPPFK